MSKHTQNYTVDGGGFIDVCFRLQFSADDAAKLKAVELTQKRYIVDYVEREIDIATLAATAKDALMASISDPKKADALKAKVAQRKAEATLADAIEKLKAAGLTRAELEAMLPPAETETTPAETTTDDK